MAKPKKVANKDIDSVIQNREDFDGSSLTGRNVAYPPQTGRMNEDDAKALAGDNPSYVVSSYGTPIAWHGDKGWVMPKTKYSTTTSKHQTQVGRSLEGLMAGHDAARQ